MSEGSDGIASLDQRIPFLLSQLGSYMAREFQRQLVLEDLQPRAYAVLMALATFDGQSQRQLSARLGIHRNVMVNTIDTLEEDGLVQRKPHPDDRRAFAITLTERAQQLLPEIDLAARRLEDTVTATLSPEERVVLRDMLQRIAGDAGLIPGIHPGLVEDAPC